MEMIVSLKISDLSHPVWCLLESGDFRNTFSLCHMALSASWPWYCDILIWALQQVNVMVTVAENREVCVWTGDHSGLSPHLPLLTLELRPVSLRLCRAFAQLHTYHRPSGCYLIWRHWTQVRFSLYCIYTQS